MKKLLLAFCTVLLLSNAYSQTTFGWRNEATNGNWADANNWWNGTSAVAAGFGVLFFDNNNQTTMNNDTAGTLSTHRLEFRAGSSVSRTISGNPIRLFDSSGADPKIENLSAVSHTLSLAIAGDGDAADPLEINPVNGDLTLSGTLNNSGSPINVWGNNAKTLTISGVISGTGVLSILQNSNVVLTAQNTYTGLTTVSAGSLRLFRTGGTTIPATNNVTVSNGATLRISTNQTIANLDLSGGGNLTVDASVVLTITGTYTGGSGTINNLGTISLSGTAAQTFPGSSAVINNGTANTLTNLTVNNTLGVTLNKAIAVSGTLALTAGTVTTGGNLTMGTGATITRNAGSLSAAPTFAGTVNVTYNNTAAINTGVELPTAASVLNNLTISSSGGVATLQSSIQINGIWAHSSSNNFNLGTANIVTFAGTSLTRGGAGFTGGTTNVVFTNASNITIPSGFFNTNNINSITINGGGITLAANLTVQTALTLTSGTITVGAFTLTYSGTAANLTRTSGTINASAGTVSFNNSAAAYSLSSILFSGGNPNAISVNGAGVTLASALTVTSALNLVTGTLNNTSFNITLGNGATITRSATAGVLTAVPVFGTTVNVTYNNSASIVPSFELPNAASFPTTLNNLTIASAGTTINVTLPAGAASIQVNGTLALSGSSTGSLGVSSNTITFGPSSSLTRSGTVAINATNAAASIVFANTSPIAIPSGAFGGNPSNITINGSGGVTLGSNLQVTNTTLTSGNITLDNFNYVVPSAGTFTGGSLTSHFITNGTGRVQRQISLGGGAFTFHVGRDASTYNPLTITNTGAATSIYTVGAASTTYTPATNGANTQWAVTCATATTSTLAFQWDTADSGANLVAAPSTGEAYQFNGSIFIPITGTTTGTPNVTTITGINLPIASRTYAIANTLNISTSAITPTTYCSGTTVSVPYTSAGSFSGTFTAQLSDATGSFAAPVNIGTGISPITATIPFNTSAGTAYRIRVVNNNPSIVGSNNGDDLTVNASTTTGSVTQSQVGGSYTWPANGLTYTASTTQTVVSGCNTATLNLTISPTIWNGSSWSNSAPTATVDAVINGAYSTSAAEPQGPFSARSLTVNATTGNLTINSGTNVTVQNAVVNNGTMTIQNNANLIQVNNVANSGSVTVNRNGSTLKRLDYTLWSSPVAPNQTLLNFSDLTVTPRFYQYNESSNLYNAVVPSATTFATGKGYLIRMPDQYPANSGNGTTYYAGSTTLAYPGVFTGVLNNGDIPVTLAKSEGINKGYQAVGNPYPSVIDAQEFVTANTANIENTLYFWRKTNGASGSSYATWTSGGGTSVTPSSETPNGKIQVGQGFFVQAKNAVTVSNFFTNAMRDEAPSSTQFFKTKQQAQKDRVWLNLTTTTGVFSQALVAYIDDATLGLDKYDGKYINDSGIALTTSIAGDEYTIQGRPTFDATDVVALNFKTSVAGTYTIAIDHVDGLFSKGQDIYLVDKTTGITTNLNEGAYTFTAAVGVDNTRFTLTYQKTLKVGAPLFNENSVLVSRSNGTLNVKSSAVAINNVKVYDVQGRLVAERKNVKSNTATISNLRSNQVLIVKVTSENNAVVTKKVLN